MQPRAARETQEQAAEQRRNDDDAADADAAGHEAYDQQQQRKDQERPIDVRVLEGRADALVVEKNLRAGHQVKKPEIAGKRRKQSGKQVGAAQNAEPCQIAAAE